MAHHPPDAGPIRPHPIAQYRGGAHTTAEQAIMFSVLPVAGRRKFQAG